MCNLLFCEYVIFHYVAIETSLKKVFFFFFSIFVSSVPMI